MDETTETGSPEIESVVETSPEAPIVEEAPAVEPEAA